VFQHISEGDTVIDVGANVGYYSMGFAKRVKPKGKVIAIEPIPANMKNLKLNCKLNNLNNVIFIDKAASDRTSEAEICIPRGVMLGKKVFMYFGDSSIQFIPRARTFNLPSRKIKVCTTTLDFLTKDLKEIKVIKIDAEGAEAQVLSGSVETLGKTHLLYIECQKENLSYVTEILRKINYSYQLIEVPHAVHILAKNSRYF
jgi:FkbM family methyltransferase